MKKLMAAVSLTTVFISPAVLADYELYGKANLGILSTDSDNTNRDGTDLKSFASRIGIKGNVELSEGLDAIYQWEAEVDITGENTNGTDGLLKARNQYLGLQGGFGKLIGGIHDTPMKQAEGKIDLFSDIFDMARVQDPYMDTQEREKDFVGYYSPKFGNMQLQVATMPGKGKELGDAFSTALIYGDKNLKKSNVFAAVAYDSGVDATEDSNALRVSGSTRFGSMTVGGIYEKADNGKAGTEKQNRYVVSGAYTMGKNTLQLQYANSEDADAIAGSTDTTLGLSHKLGKNTSLYGAINSAENVGGVKGEDDTNFVVGIVHKFKL